MNDRLTWRGGGSREDKKKSVNIASGPPSEHKATSNINKLSRASPFVRLQRHVNKEAACSSLTARTRRKSAREGMERTARRGRGELKEEEIHWAEGDIEDKYRLSEAKINKAEDGRRKKGMRKRRIRKQNQEIKKG